MRRLVNRKSGVKGNKLIWKSRDYVYGNVSTKYLALKSYFRLN